MADNHGTTIATSKDLAVRLAGWASAIRRKAHAALAVETEQGRLRRLLNACRESLLQDLPEDDFADMLAQTIVYGLLLARLSPSAAAAPDVMRRMVPATSPLLQELMSTFSRDGRRQRASSGNVLDFGELDLQEVTDTLRQADIQAVLRDFDNRNPQEDPVIHFYELFLREYDPQRRMQRGVFYTPRAVVSFLVRSVHELLQTAFGLEDGLASTVTWREMADRHPPLPLGEGRGQGGHVLEYPGISLPNGTDPDSPFVTVLDPATGTATFLVEVIDVIYRTLTAKWDRQRLTPAQQKAAWNDYVPRHLLPRLYGYELLMAPYAVAHLKLGLKLWETGYEFGSDQRVRVYLTNALEPATDHAEPGLFSDCTPWLAHEARAVNAVKRQQRFTVVLGNPPYSGVSSNMNSWIDGLLKRRLGAGGRAGSYYEVDGRALGEKKLWLQDDYVKFIRLGQWLIEETGIGILGYVSNHGYLDNPTFRGMRQSLRATFPCISVTDLHGNAKKSERCPDGRADENMFEIEQGVAIGVLWRPPERPAATVRHSELWGDREGKGKALLGTTAVGIESRQLWPASPFYLFAPFDDTKRSEYEAGWTLTEVMPVNVTGMVTARDHFVIDFDRNVLLERIAIFRSSLSDQEVRDRYFAGHTRSQKYPDGDTRGWKLSAARQRVLQDPDWERRPERCLYRPFDKRWVYYVDWMVDWSRRDRMRHMLSGENVGLIARRQMLGANLTFFFATDCLISDGVIRSDNKGSESLFPLYLDPEPGALGAPAGREANLNTQFVQAVGGATGLAWAAAGRGDLQTSFGPEDVLHFLYAQFFSPAYRRRFADLLRRDFPRVFLPGSRGLFAALCRCGADLLALHLLRGEYPAASWNQGNLIEQNPFQNPGSQLAGDGPAEVTKGFPKFLHGNVYIQPSRWFTDVPAAVWEFQIGTYRVCEKWLKDRRGRKLSQDDILHYQRIVVALSETIRLRREIDEAVDQHGGWPDAFLTNRKNVPAGR